MVIMNILQVVGFKNCGKTTRIEKWVRFLSSRNLSVSVIKHHGHGGPLSMPSADTDSMKFLAQGSVSSIAVSDNMIQLHMQPALELQSLIALAEFAKPDFLLIEGFKEASQAKVVIVRTKEEWELLRHLSHIVLVLAYAYADVDIDQSGDVKVMRVDDDAGLQNWIVDYVEGDRSNEAIRDC
ncbi:molybdopterin-guanine dinucleotide biosynthesis protein B [Paenibacillus selenitireducens]|uniref:Molybdopterin-guanine dinucleotide biosynthesis protein B n=1 Tax=Paenibacillus selenitireducens TaxID=1324314 RepID=A0A1T2X8F9_9BACL|nr:molybdopterin-guanine dinucleotide biosynthesis protein B [Paenibacillus selenitireducens]OPA76154.1 molybdopterin-guanine dinucleotide biosynthesis protein B [Paenibacillus selenitireducens]